MAIEHSVTRTGKRAVFVRAEIVEDSDDVYTLYIGGVVNPIAFRRVDHPQNFSKVRQLFQEGADARG